MLSRLAAWFGRLFGSRRAQPTTADPLAAIDGVERSSLRVVVGLGNPGEQFHHTRHNVGFDCVDLLAQRQSSRWSQPHAHTRSLLTSGTVDGVPLLLVKPQTYMNLSGQTVQALIDLLQIDPRQVLVVYDDMDLPLGALRLRERGSPGTHNGMRSIVRETGTEAIARLRIGIGQPAGRNARDFVLDRFEGADAETARASVERAADAAVAWATLGPSHAMNLFNR